MKQVAFNKKCPVSGKDVDPAKLFAINFCCGNCLADFTKAPAKHIAKVKGPDNKKVPDQRQGHRRIQAIRDRLLLRQLPG